MALPTASDNKFSKVIIQEAANDGSDFSNPAADYRVLFVGEDGLFHLKDSAGTVTTPAQGAIVDPMTTRGDTLIRNSSNVTARLAVGAASTYYGSDGTDPSWSAVTDAKLSTSDVTTNNASTTKHGFLKKLSNSALDFMDGTGAWSVPGGGGGASPSYLGYNTVGGSTQAMTTNRLYCKQITAGGSGNVLLGVQAYLANTVEATLAYSFSLFADSGTDTIGNLLSTTADALPEAPINATGNYPARWLGKAITYALAASTKYWVGVVITSGAAAPNLYYDGSGTDRYLALGSGGYTPDGAYVSQTNTGNKHSIRALVL